MSTVWVGVLVACGALVTIVAVSFDRFVRQRQGVLAARADVEAELQRRADLVPRLVEAVTLSQAHERGSFVDTALARATAAAPASGGVVSPDDEEIWRSALADAAALVESVPVLVTSSDARSLVRRLVMAEDRIAVARRLHNSRVAAYNRRVEGVPSRVVARLGGFSRAPYLAGPTADDGAGR